VSDDFDDLIERMIPGSRRKDDPPPELPAALGLEPLGIAGKGTAGWVLRARDPVLDRVVAVKIARPGFAAALRREASDTARLAHPAVLPVHRVVEADDRLCVEYRLAPETTLAALLSDWLQRPEAAWSLSRRLSILLPAIQAVAKAHALGLVHGDLHPGNVAVGQDGEPYVLDWSGPGPADGRFRGPPGYASPEQLRGEAAGPADDVHAIGAILWELCSLHAMRPRKLDESDGEYVHRYRNAPPPPLPPETGSGLVALVADGLGPAGRRPTAAQLAERLALILTGEADRVRKLREAEGLVEESRAALTRYGEGEKHLAQERQNASVHRARVPGWAPLDEKRAVWDAEDRAAALLEEQVEAWVDATEKAIEATALVPDGDEAHAVLADLWWARMRNAEARSDAAEASMARRRVRKHDRARRYARLLDAPALVTLSCPAPGARVRIARFDDAAIRVPHLVDERALPLERHPLPTGSWLLTISAPGYADAPYPVHLDRLDHHRGRVDLFTAEQVGEGWVYVPAGPFRMGGDPLARNAIDPCSPTLSNRFFTRHCVTSAEYLEFLHAIDDGERHAPAETGLFGQKAPLWRRDPEGRFVLPPGWDPRWPVMNVNLDDARAYAAWRSEKEGRVVRVPTEDEWEKAARGVDGRWWPWGNRFDPTFCRMRESEPGPPRPSPVGAFPTDRSVYGLMDTAGGMREWTTSSYSTGQVVVRGGTWGDDADDCRCAGRTGLQPPFRMVWVGFRLVSEQPRPGRA
jgi:formylglycine-generating enzyme required for sulfatase activity